MGEDYQPSVDVDKEKRYDYVIASLEGVLDANTHPISNLSNFIALLKQEFNWWWIGYYFVSSKVDASQDLLVLGPFQGPLACTVIKRGKGVCGSSWDQQKSIIVQDVNKFEGHIACSSDSKSEIVIPLMQGERCIGVLDIDSQKYAQFDQIDERKLTKMLKILQKLNTWQWVIANI